MKDVNTTYIGDGIFNLNRYDRRGDLHLLSVDGQTIPSRIVADAIGYNDVSCSQGTTNNAPVIETQIWEAAPDAYMAIISIAFQTTIVECFEDFEGAAALLNQTETGRFAVKHAQL